KGRILEADSQYTAIGVEIDGMVSAYKNSLAMLSTAYPVLAAFADLDKSTGDLERLATKGAGKDMATLIGEKVAETLSNIAQVREGLGSKGGINVWRLDPIVQITRAQLGVDGNPVTSALINEKVKREAPGILAELALLVLNVAAIAIAAETGGLSLVVAAGVNAAVAVKHVDEYLTAQALRGTAFDKAKALSQEDPSLFWLAVEIVGTAVDVGTAAFTVFKTLRPLVQ